jgi:hypothetical protein
VTYGVSPITLSATGGGSGNAVTFSVLSGPGFVSGNTLTITGAGTVVVAANQKGNANYAAAAQVTQSIVVNPAPGIPQTITFTPPTSPVTYGNMTQPVYTLVQKCHPVSNTSNTCTFPNNVTPGDLVIGGAAIDNTIASTGVTDGAGNAFNLTPNSPCIGGAVTSHAWLFYLLSSPGGANTNTVLFGDNDGPNPGDYVDELWAYEFAVSGGQATFDTDTNGCGTSTTNVNPVSTLTLSGSNELAYFDSLLFGGTATGAGTPWTTGTLSQFEDVDGYDTSASNSIATSIVPAGEGWGIVMAMALRVVPPGHIILSATGGASGNPVTFSVQSGPGAINGNSLVLTGAGTVVVAASQAGNSTYAPANEVTQSIVVNQGTQAITFTPSSPVSYPVSPITLSATGGSSFNPVTFSVISGPGSITGNTLTITGSGTVMVAANEAGNANYAAAPQVTQSIVVNPESQTITFTAPTSPVTFGVSPITLSATGGGSGNPVTFSVASGPGSISGNMLTITGAGTVVVAANQTGGGNYAAATQVTRSVVVNQAAQTVSFAPPALETYGVAAINLAPYASATSGLGVSFSVVSGPATISGTTVTITGKGSVVIQASQAGNSNYSGATPVQKTINVSAATLTVTASNMSRAYETANPTFTDAITGFVNGDTVSVVSGTAALSTTATLASTVGTYPIASAQGTLAAANYTFVFANGTLTVTQATPAITWATPAPIYCCNPITTTQLNATTPVAGTFAYNRTLGEVLPPGSWSITATFTPTDTVDYKTASASVTLVINKGNPVIVWSAPAAITYGTALGATQLDAKSSYNGTFTYNPPAGTVLQAGSQTLSVTLNPTSTTDYNSATTSVSLTVNQATPQITWATPTAISYGTALGATQLNASSPVAGTYSYSPALGTVLATGVHTIGVTFTPTDTKDYTSATSSVQLTVNRATPPITWATPAAITYPTALSSTQLDANSTVAGTFVYSPASGTVLNGRSQTLSVTFTPTDSTNYTTAIAMVTLTINPIVPVVTWGTPAAINYGTALSATQLNATASVAGTFVYSPSAGTVVTAGAETLSVTFTPTNSADYATVTSTVMLTVNKVTPVVTWATPAAISCCNPFTGTQLDATASVAGTFAYSRPIGTVLPPGSWGDTATFTPTDIVDYNTATASVTITIVKGNPVIVWNAPAAITYGTALSATQLDAKSEYNGTFSYTPPAGTVLKAGLQTLSVTLNPTSTTDYNSATATVPLTVNQATPVITWAAPAPITYGTALSATQLNATASVPGTFVYSLALGKVLNAGTQTLSVTFTPTDNTDFATVTSTAQLIVNQVTPSITWATPAPITYGTALSGAQLNASSTLPGSFVYSPATGAVLNAGSQTLSVTFTPADSTDYATVTSTVVLTVSQVTPILTWASPATISYGTPLSGVQLNASAPVAGTFTYSPAAGTVLTVGTQMLSVTFSPTNATDYTGATANVSITVVKTTPTITWPAPAPIFCCNGLTATQLGATANAAGTFTYNYPLGTVLPPKSWTLTVNFTPTDTVDYYTATASVTLVVNKGNPVIVWNPPAAITYGTALSATQLNAKSSYNGTFTYTPTFGTIPQAGSQTLSVTLNPTSTTDYNSATTTVSLTVNQAVLTVAANNLSIPYGSAIPNLTYTLSGFVNGDAAATATSGMPSLSTTATSASLPGTYPITPAAGTLTAANYNFAFSNGTLTVNPLGTLATPTFSVAGGTYASTQTVNIMDGSSGATIYYTTNGTTPSATNGTKFTGSITVSATETIEAIAVEAGYTSSAVAIATYTIN